MKVTLAHLIPLLLLSSSITAWAADETPVQLVSSLYRDYAWEALIEEPTSVGRTLIEQPEVVLQRYLDDKLTALILKDQECVRRTHEICRLDFVPIWDSQDPGGTTDLHVSASRNEPAIVKVWFRYADGKIANLRFDMAKTARGWRIGDVEYPSAPSLLKQLTAK